MPKSLNSKIGFESLAESYQFWVVNLSKFLVIVIGWWMLASLLLARSFQMIVIYTVWNDLRPPCAFGSFGPLLLSVGKLWNTQLDEVKLIDSWNQILRASTFINYCSISANEFLSFIDLGKKQPRVPLSLRYPNLDVLLPGIPLNALRILFHHQS